MKRYKVGQRN